MSGANMLVHVTHIDDSPRGRQGPCVYFWGITHDRSLYQLMLTYIENIRPMLESSPPPLHQGLLVEQICCALINHNWHRVKVTELKLSSSGTLEVFCIDTGATHLVPLAFIRTLDIPGPEADCVREWHPLASKFLLADVVAPRGPGTRSQWSEPAMMFLKLHVENQTWKAVLLGIYDGVQGVRLYNNSNKLLATSMINQGLGIEAQTYQDAVKSCEEEGQHPAFMKPAINIFPAAGCKIPAMSNTLPPAFAIPAACRDQRHFCSLVPQQMKYHPTKLRRAFVTTDLPRNGRHDVKVSHISDGPFKFSVQMKSDMEDLNSLRRKLDKVTPLPLPGIPELGSPCIAVSPTDKLFHRGMITSVNEYKNECTVYFVDIGFQEAVNFNLVCEIPNDLLGIRLYACRVSLQGAEEVANLPGLYDIFASLVNSSESLQCEVVEIDHNNKQKVNLYDRTGRSLLNVFLSLSTIVMPGKTLNLASISPVKGSSSPSSACITEIPTPELASEEILWVTHAEELGCFYGQLAKLPDAYLDAMTTELKNAYSSHPNPPLLYADVKSHLGHLGVHQWDEDKTFYRVRVINELVNEVEIRFVDFGNTIRILRSAILAPLESLTRFRSAPFGIRCRLEGNLQALNAKWPDIITQKPKLQVKIGKCDDGVYSVTLSNTTINADIIEHVTPNFTTTSASTGKTVLPDKVTTTSSQDVRQTENALQQTEDRRRNNRDAGNSGKSSQHGTRSGFGSYIHPNANSKESKWRNLLATTSEEGGTKTFQKSSSRDANPKVAGVPLQEVIRAPRGPPPPTGEDIKGPLGFQRKAPTESSHVPETSKIATKDTGVSFTQTSNAVPKCSKVTPQTSVQTAMSFAKQNSMSGSIKFVEVVFTNSPSSFYVQLADLSSQLNDLATKLNEFYSDESKPCLQNAKPDCACVVRYKEDFQWYRGQILEINSTGAKVLFVDYGNTQLNQLEEIKAIEAEFLLPPPLAVHCKMQAIKEPLIWTKEEMTKFEEAILGKTMLATFSRLDSDGKYRVDLVDESGNKNLALNELLSSPIFKHIKPPNVSYTNLPTSNNYKDVSIAWFYSPNRFFTSPVDLSAYQAELDGLEEFYSILSANELMETEPTVGSPCVVRFTEDQRYYRSQIIAIRDQIAEVLFVDYGNEQDTPLSELKRMIPRFMQFPQLTWQSRLKGVRSVAPLKPEQQKHVERCFLTGETLSALFSPFPKDGVFDVDLSVPGIGDAAQYLLRHHVVEQIRPKVKEVVHLAPQNLSFAPDEIIAVAAVCPFIKSLSEFWIQLDADVVENLMKSIDTLEPSSVNEADFVAAVGSACLAFFVEDGRWYRAQIIAVNEEIASVYYVDFGNTCDVSIKKLRPLPASYTQQPALAYRCCLVGADAFSGNIASEIEVLITDVTLQVKCVRVSEGTLHVRLYNSDGVDFIQQHCNKTTVLQPIQEEQVELIPEQNELSLRISDLLPPPTSTCVIENNLTVEEDLQVSLTGLEPAVSEFLDETVSLTELQPPSSVDIAFKEPVRNNEVEVCIVYTLSPSAFWFQLKKNEPMLLDMQNRLVERYEESVDSFSVDGDLTIDQLYGVYHSTYETWYRAQLKAIMGDQVKVYFIDYGDNHTLPLIDVRMLPDEFVNIPPMAIKGSLNFQTTEWQQEAINRFETFSFDATSITRMVFGKFKNGIQYVDSLFVGDENVSEIMATYCEATEVSADQPPADQPPEANAVPPVDVGVEVESNENRNILQSPPPLLQIEPVTSEVTEAPLLIESSTPAVDETITETQQVEQSLEADFFANYVDKLLDTSFNFVSGEVMSSVATVAHIESASEVWVHLDPGAVDSLMEDIHAANVSQCPVMEALVGRHCLAKFPEDLGWYRAMIKEVDGDAVTVFYVDYGNSSVVDRTDLRWIPVDLAKQPAHALKCALDGIQHDIVTIPSADDCREVLTGEILTVIYIDRSSDATYVRFLDTAGNELNEKLGLPDCRIIEERREGEEAVPSDHLVASTPNDVQASLEEAIVNGDVEISAVMVEHQQVVDDLVETVDLVCESLTNVPVERFEVEKPSEVELVNIIPKEEAPVFDEREEEVLQQEEEPAASAPIDHSTVLGEFVECVVEVKQEYAERIYEYEPHQGEISYIDLDPDVTMEEVECLVDPQDIIPQNFTETDEIQPTNCSNEEEEAAAVTVADLPVDENPNMETVSSEPEADCPNVETVSSQPEDEIEPSTSVIICDTVTSPVLEDDVFEVTTEQAPNETGTSEECPFSNSNQETVVATGDLEPEDRAVTELQQQEEVVEESKPAIPGGECVYVSHIVSPGEFFVQKVEEESAIGDIDKQLVEMGVEVLPNFKLEGAPMVGQLYAVRHSEFGYWYRAQLLKIDGEEAVAVFVDYGDIQTVPLSSVRKLSRLLQHIPFMAVRCKLAAVHLDHWPAKATRTMEKLCPPEQICVAAFRSPTGKVLEVESLYAGQVNVINKVLASLVNPLDDSSSSEETIPQPDSGFHGEPDFSMQQGQPQVVDAQLYLIRVKPETGQLETAPDSEAATADEIVVSTE